MNFPKKAFMPFVVLGDPDYEQSLRIVKTLIENKADALELGFAFSDPIADGPTIQKANKRVLDRGFQTKDAFSLLKDIRELSSIPISLMLSFNIAFRHGVEEFYRKCKELGINAILFPDIPPEESEEVMRYSRQFNIDQVFLVSETSSEQRMKNIGKLCSGYVYLVSLLGTTGTRDELNNYLPDMISCVKKNIDLPVYVGFGISKPEHVRKVFEFGADGAIAGSAICSIIESNLDETGAMIEKIKAFCRSIKD